MAKKRFDTTFNFGANAPRRGKGRKSKKSTKGTPKQRNQRRTAASGGSLGVSNAPIPD